MNKMTQKIAKKKKISKVND